MSALEMIETVAATLEREYSKRPTDEPGLLAAALREALGEIQARTSPTPPTEEQIEAIQWALKIFEYGRGDGKHPHAAALRSLLSQWTRK